MSAIELKFYELACSFFGKFKQPSRKDRVRETASRMMQCFSTSMYENEDIVRMSIDLAEELENQLDKRYNNQQNR